MVIDVSLKVLKIDLTPMQDMLNIIVYTLSVYVFIMGITKALSKAYEEFEKMPVPGKRTAGVELISEEEFDRLVRKIKEIGERLGIIVPTREYRERIISRLRRIAREYGFKV